jgi:hypothetical protein
MNLGEVRDRGIGASQFFQHTATGAARLFELWERLLQPEQLAAVTLRTEGSDEDIRTYINRALLITCGTKVWLPPAVHKASDHWIEHAAMPLSEIQLRAATIILALPEATRSRIELRRAKRLVGNRSVDRGQYEQSTLGIVEEAGDDRRTRSEEVGCHVRWRVPNSQPDRLRRVAKEK